MKNEDLYVYKKSDFYEDFISSQKEYYEREQVDTLISEKDWEIAELKKKLMPCINGDCILTCEVVEKYGKENAELKKKLGAVNELVKESKEWLKESQKIHNRCADGAIKKIRHNKYKRCLAMVEMCQARYDVEDVKVNGHCASWDYTESEEMKYWERWHKRWLELAEKFKEGK